MFCFINRLLDSRFEVIEVIAALWQWAVELERNNTHHAQYTLDGVT